ncbi:MAG: metallophosphoesterase [Oscillospiraceae bacterium]|nr:metallophosphoesterase [Oscillospiraceae bacterium]
MIAFLIIPIVIALAIFALDLRLAVRRHVISAKSLKKPLRIVLLADHHSSPYGKNQVRLLDEIHAAKPDLILLAGDMVDDKRPYKKTAQLYQGLRNYPVYYVIGNHECRRADMAAMKALAESYGITVLTDETMTAEVGGVPLLLGGIDDPEKAQHRDSTFAHKAVMEQVFTPVKSASGYRILIAHKPEHIKTYARYGFDLVVSGHAHGGQVRIPGLLNGLYSPGQGLFPRWAGGVYRHGATTHVVTRGLSKTVFPPRIFNRPELVVIDLAG